LLDGAGVAPGVERLDSGLAVVLRDEDDDELEDGDGLLGDELGVAERLESAGELRSHCDVPLVAEFGDSLQ
jgi:hypothetical protein